jgi:hypothetical protein
MLPLLLTQTYVLFYQPKSRAFTNLNLCSLATAHIAVLDIALLDTALLDTALLLELTLSIGLVSECIGLVSTCIRAWV